MMESSNMSDIRTRERVKFRLIWTPCCHTLLCWVNSRLPNFCPECGLRVYAQIKATPDCILVTDEEAWLSLKSATWDLLNKE